MSIVVALGGNALLRRGEPAEAATQRATSSRPPPPSPRWPQRPRARHHPRQRPQVGLLALEADAYKAVAPYPLDVLGAESQGMIGYLLAQALGQRARPSATVVTLLTQVLVDPDDPAFARPTKPIGPVYDEEKRAAARRRARLDDRARRRHLPPGRRLAGAAGDRRARGDRALLVAAGSVVVCAGGGGIPVVADLRRAARRRGGDRQGPDRRAARRGARRRRAASC